MALNAQTSYSSTAALEEMIARDGAYSKTGERTRHINLRFHRVREAVAKDSIYVKLVTVGNDPATSEVVADILTKSTPAPLSVVVASVMSGMHRK